MKALYCSLPLLISAVACESQASTSPNQSSLSTADGLGSAPPTVGLNEEDLSLKISTEPNLTMAMIEADGKFHIWMEGRSGLLRLEPANTFWLEQGGVSIRQGKGQRHMEIDGHIFFTPGSFSKTALGEKLNTAPKNTSGYAISLEMTSKGKYITSLTAKNKRPVRIASTVQKPSRSAIYTIPNVSNTMGTPTPALSSEVLTAIKTKSAPPTEGIQTFVNASPEQAAAWSTELKSIFGGVANVQWSGMINLDSKEGNEAIVCTPTPQEKTCFVVVSVDGQNRYYHTDFSWDGTNKPSAFKVGTNIYLHHKTALKKGFVNKVLVFDGSGYSSQQL